MRIICYYTATSQGQPSRSPWRENNSRPPGIRGEGKKMEIIKIMNAVLAPCQTDGEYQWAESSECAYGRSWEGDVPGLPRECPTGGPRSRRSRRNDERRL
nr:MAG TPA: hypothetical protein [Caudoviricetes sp.]